MGFLIQALQTISSWWGSHQDGSYRSLQKVGLSLGLVASSCVGLAFTAPTARALEEVQLTYGLLEAKPIAFSDLEAFAFSGVPSRDIKILLDILRINEETAQDVLTKEIPIDFDGLRDASETFIGETFWRLVGTAVTLTDSTGEGWEQLRNALISAAEDDRITLLEVLQNIEASLMVIDTQRVITISSQVRQDVDDIQSFFSIFGESQDSNESSR